MNEADGQNRRRPQHVFRWLVGIASVFVVLVGLASFFGRQFLLAELINNFRFQVAIAIVGLSLLLFHGGRPAWASLQLVFGLVVMAPVAVSFWPPESVYAGSGSDAGTISLLSYNVLGDNTDQQPALELIQEQFADLTVVIEYENAWVKTLEPLDSIYRFSKKEERWHGFGIAVYSQHLLKDTVVEKTTDDSDIPCILTEVHPPGQPFILAAVHLFAPMDGKRMNIRNGQMRRVAKLINEYRAERNLPVVLVGDFNCVPWSSFARELLLETDLTDSRQGYFYHGSWPTNNFLMRIPIDNAFVSDGVHIKNRILLPETSSDHFPLYLEFSIASAVDRKQPERTSDESAD